MPVLNLQNTPDSALVTRHLVSFDSSGTNLSGLLFKPTDMRQASSLPAVVVTGAWTSVKEQMAGTYARALAEQGLIALAFDFAGWGQSGGIDRFIEDPVSKTTDIQAAAAYLSALPDVDSSRITALGVCASSGYALDAASESQLISKLALVAPWLHTPALAELVYGGAQASAALKAASEAAEKEAMPTILTAASLSDDTAPMFQAPYYTEADRGLIAEYDNKFDVRTWSRWLGYNAHQKGANLDKPMLFVGSDGIALPQGVAEFEEKARAKPRHLWLADTVTQFDFYDRPDVVKDSVAAVAKFAAE